MMRRKEVYINITPIPSSVPRQLALDILHSHSEIITLNPLVISHQPVKAPRDAVADEYYSTWYEITERVQYLPGLGKMGSGKISFKGCFHNVEWGLETHMYAPMGIDLKSKWRIAGDERDKSEPREEREASAPQTGLYLREDIEIECNRTLISFVKTQLKAASKVLVDRLIKKAELLDAGVLQGMMEDGKLTTYNPADRSSRIMRGASVASRRSDQMSMSSSSWAPRSPTESVQLGSMAPGYGSPVQYGQDHGKSFAAELPADFYHPQPGSDTYQELPDTSRYSKPTRLDKGYAELAAMEETSEERSEGVYLKGT
ncbi:hypothetical protein N7447_001071 [Penicillium robsamsonii]|uniref:uncharacterized protein n=1 Tax=Penicillium robsamsonii TaxID=1792511 RepID=UPI002547012A|nr:uncharacterized protein N7447_001071 [Penicillium robsamsonii]KAJ5835045.1 hypothetical protein N7447_001071 [Penicillium robsamsonii]